MACDLALRLMGRSLPSFAGWSGCPSIAVLSINPGIDAMGHFRTRAPQSRPHSITSSAQAIAAYSGNPAFRSPSINSVAFECPPRAINADIVKAGSS